MKYLLICFDLESTGLSTYHDRIIQIAACAVVYDSEQVDEKILPPNEGTETTTYEGFKYNVFNYK
jgi:DNA polymerase III epsilon subunit-like protein